METNDIIRSHPNTFLMRKDFFMQMNLYDEDFVGNYGHDDTFIVQFSFVKNKAVVQGCDFAIEQCKQQGHYLQRDAKINSAELRHKKGNHSKMILRFPWEFVEEIDCI